MSRETSAVFRICQFSGKRPTLLSHGNIQKDQSALRSFGLAGGKETLSNDQVSINDGSLDTSLAKGLQCRSSLWLWRKWWSKGSESNSGSSRYDYLRIISVIDGVGYWIIVSMSLCNRMMKVETENLKMLEHFLIIFLVFNIQLFEHLPQLDHSSLPKQNSIWQNQFKQWFN